MKKYFALAAVALLASAPAQAVETFNFTFTGTTTSPFASLSGPQSGSFSLSLDNDIFSLTAFNATLAGVIYGLGQVGLEQTLVPNFLIIGGLTFGADAVPAGFDDFYLSFSEAFVTSGTSSNAQIVVSRTGVNGTGFARATITAVNAAVPEPASWAMMLVGFGAAGVAMRHRKRVSSLLQFA